MNLIDANRELIERALEYSGGTHTFEDVKEAILESKMQIWPAQRGVAVTEIIVYPARKVLHVFLAAGELEQLIDMIDAAAEWGRSQGCQSLTMTGRKGWLRVLAGHGWRERHVTMEREI